MKNSTLFENPDGPPRLVLWAVFLLALLFLCGAAYLLMVNPFSGVVVVGIKEFPSQMAMVADYHGTVIGLEGMRSRVRAEMTRAGMLLGPAVTIFPSSPSHLRPIAVNCELGYLTTSMNLSSLGISRLKTLSPGLRFVIKVKGRGNFSGSKAYKAGAHALAEQGRKPGEGERFEVKFREQGVDWVEHWVPYTR